MDKPWEFQPGNKLHEKLNTPELRQKVYKHFCKYLEDGNFVDYWYYDEDGIQLTYQSLYNYFKRYPEEFEPEQRKVADSKGFQYWFSVVKQSAIGKNKDANTASLQMLMRNKYGWDKEKDQNSKEKEPVKIIDATNPVQPETD